MKMQRRSFLKTVGATLAGTLGLGATKSLPKPVEPKFATGGFVYMDRPFPRLSGKHDGEFVLPRHYPCRCQTEVNIHVETMDTKSMQVAFNNSSREIRRILTGA